MRREKRESHLHIWPNGWRRLVQIMLHKSDSIVENQDPLVPHIAIAGGKVAPVAILTRESSAVKPTLASDDYFHVLTHHLNAVGEQSRHLWFSAP